ncbi:sterol desaturase/sphingolipid hydroxylase (fatty acid hydroxylase superfamily) [Chitinivorax tropicus]|uniref:Sterol desaturase/sphingolipid hydroxylase (Fatty acid hydroxylase superfamily) n=1 Tax=Chitinivorax tropicus TaxID=714531 RepID=A0A840MJN7_9PROT|nr:sterol desaturase family protein [Chitinivorax tropicus]MBB5017037.1 sterol desaturase/sphingolipid hydroxylase (fatty acid hydroxylase superfamily) [Chitinivorax tropicus]
MAIDPGLILLALAPIFVLTIAIEAWYWHGKRAMYTWRDTLSNAALALMHQASDALFLWAFVKTAYLWVYQHGPQWVAMPNPWGVVCLFILQDFLYYWFHRASHRIRWMWASHVVHHSSERMNFSTAFRQSLTYPLSGMWLFWLPLAWVGFPPEWVILAVGLSLAYQFFVHTQAVGKLGWVEWIFNTPSHHRAHHGRNPQYIDKNYAGVLIIWDRLFGTFEAEVAPPDYGIIRPIHSHNPLLLTFHEWRDMLQAAWQYHDLRFLWKPPEWSRDQPNGQIPPKQASDVI